MRILSFVLGLLTCTAAFGANLNSGKEVFKSGDWSVRQTPDLMKGKQSCTALYRDTYKVLLTDDGLFLSQAANGGLKGYSVRFDDEPAGADRLVSPFERDIQSAVLKNDEYAKVLASKRLRVRITTASDVTVEEDLDLSAIRRVHDVIVSGKGCH